MHSTRHDLPAQARERMVALLDRQLADALDLYSQVKHAHWNVKGAGLSQFHELFDTLAEALEDSVDLIAERATALGGVAMGSVRAAAAASRLPEYPADVTDGLPVVAALADRYAAYAATTRAAITAAEEAGDAGTADLFTEVSRGVDKHLWLLEAHLQA
jgi:starvation-inducible DNA-binding protein